MNQIQLFLGVCSIIAAPLDNPQMPKGKPSEQVAALRAQLERAREDYIRRFEKATTTTERDMLMKDVPQTEPYAELMLKIAERNLTDAAALDALLWTIENTSSGSKDSPNSRAKASIVKNYFNSNRLTPFAVSLSWSANAGDEDILRILLSKTESNQVKAAATYALALQLIAQSDMIDLYHVRMEIATSEEGRREVRESLPKDFGVQTADRLLKRKSDQLTREAEQALSSIISQKSFVAAKWPFEGANEKPLGELATKELRTLQRLRVGKSAPITSGTDINRKTVALSESKGKVVMLTFTGHWCAACRGMYPLEQELTEKYAKRPFTIFGVNSDSSLDLVKKVIAEEKMNWPIIWDGGSVNGPLATSWNVKGWPLVVLIDSYGIIRYKFRGAPISSILSPLVEKLVQEAEIANKGKS